MRYFLLYLATGLQIALAAYYWSRLRRLERRERDLLADKEAFAALREAELLSIKAHPDDAQIWLMEDGDAMPYRIIAVGRN